MDEPSLTKLGEVALHDPGPDTIRQGRRFLYDAIIGSGTIEFGESLQPGAVSAVAVLSRPQAPAMGRGRLAARWAGTA